MTVSLSAHPQFDAAKNILLIVDHGFSYTHLAGLPDPVVHVLKDHLKDSIYCYMIYDSLNKYKEWSNF